MVQKIAVVTGGASGIGLAIARQLNEDGFGIVIWDLKGDPLDPSAAGFNPIAMIATDVTNEASVDSAFSQTLEIAGRVDVLVNNAGIQVPARPIWEYDLATWEKVLSVNLSGVFLCTRSVAVHMKERGSGRILNIASVSAKHGGMNICSYASSKGAVVAFTKSIAKELAPYNVLVNAITPTMVETALMRSTGAEHIEAGKKKIPLGRLGTVEEVGAMASFICSEKCSFTTGAVFDLSGGSSTY